MVKWETGFSDKRPGAVGSENYDFHIYEREVSNNHPSSMNYPFLSSEDGVTHNK